MGALLSQVHAKFNRGDAMANELLRQAMREDIDCIAELNGRPGVHISRREMQDTIVVVARFWFTPTRGAEWRFYVDGHVTHYNWEGKSVGQHWQDNRFLPVSGHEVGFVLDRTAVDIDSKEVAEPFDILEAFVQDVLSENGVIL